MKNLYPDEYVSSIYKINYTRLWSMGYRGLMFDLDNTLAAYDCKYPDEKLIRFFKWLKSKGFHVAIVSNNNKQRVSDFNRDLQIEIQPRANKPLVYGIYKMMKRLDVTLEEAVFIGDQIFTDIWAGKRVGCRTILVKPIQEKEQWISNIKRGIEMKVLERYKAYRSKE